MDPATAGLLLPAISVTFVRLTVIVCAFVTPVRFTMKFRASLLSIAQACSLVYSFEGEKSPATEPSCRFSPG